jgi:phosphoenolpyruvate-protein kinase (PTS system EI component)
MKGVASPVAPPPVRPTASREQDLQLGDTADVPLVLVAHDLSPADMLQFKQSVFAGFVTDVGGKTSHTAIVARSMDIPAVVGARSASQLVRQDDWVIIDGDAGVVIVDPSPIILAEYGFKQRQGELERQRLTRLRHTPAVTLDGERVELLANIEMPEDAAAAVKAGAVGVGLFRSEFLFMGRQGNLPDEEEQFRAYRHTLALIDHARAELGNAGIACGNPKLGAMIEIPAAALTLPLFLKYFDFLSIGTNDLIQYTLAIDRADESVAHLYDPLHPAVLRLVADTISACRKMGKEVSVCGEMAGDIAMTKLLLGLGLRSFSMHPAQILAVKQEVLRSDAAKLAPWAERVLQSEDPAAAMAG